MVFYTVFIMYNVNARFRITTPKIQIPYNSSIKYLVSFEGIVPKVTSYRERESTVAVWAKLCPNIMPFYVLQSVVYFSKKWPPSQNDRLAFDKCDSRISLIPQKVCDGLHSQLMPMLLHKVYRPSTVVILDIQAVK